MSGWNIIEKIRKLEQRADSLGMRFTAYKHDDMYGENVALVAKDKDALPIYARDAVMFAGSLEHADRFMQGVFWAREYDRMTIDRNNDKKRERKEQDERNKQMVKILKEEKLNLVKT
jgi:hypothetical protein